MRYTLILSIVTLLAVAILYSCKKNEQDFRPPPIKYGSLEGTVKNSFGQPIDGVKVTAGTVTGKTDVEGKFILLNIEAKSQTVEVAKDGYISKNQSVTIADNQTAKIDFTLSAGDAYIALTDSVITFKPEGGSRSVRITSNAGWVIKSASAWAKISTTSGNGNGLLEISCPANAANTLQTDSIIITAGAVQKKILIRQSAEIKLLSYEGILANDEAKIPDSVYLHFNTPIKGISITSNYNLCETTIKYRYADNNKGVVFSYSCASLSGTYPFTIRAADDAGNNYAADINVPFYKSQLNVTGLIADYLFINDEKEVLIATNNPARLIKYSIVNNKVIDSYDLSKSMVPAKLTYSPYDDKVYFMGSPPNPNGAESREIRLPDVYTFDLQSGAIAKAFTIPTDPKDASYPVNIPYSLAFTKSGAGVVCLRSNTSSAIKWRLIDASNNYKLSEYTGPLNGLDSFDDVQLNYDQTRVILMPRYGKWGVFDGNTQKMTSFDNPPGSRFEFIKPSKTSNKVFLTQYDAQTVYTFGVGLSKSINLNYHDEGSVDFSYRANEDHLAYFCDDQSFKIVDYNKASVVMSSSAFGGLRDFQATKNGNLAVAYRYGSGLSSLFFVFDVNGFYKNVK